MFKIEKHLLDNHFKKVREYESGVIVYSDAEWEDEYTTEVALFTKKDPLVWEMTIYNPFGITFGSYKKDYDEKNILETHRVLTEDFVRYSFYSKEWLERLENPWEELE